MTQTAAGLFLAFSLSLSIVSMVLYAHDQGFTHQGIVLAVWLASVLAVLIPAFFSGSLKKAKSLFHFERKEFIWFGLLLLMAVGLRFYRLSSIPILGHDESRDTGLLPQAFLRGEIKDFFGYGVYGIPNLFIILSSLPHLFFPETVLAVKLLAAIFGVLSVWLTFILAREWFGLSTGLIAGFLISFYHVHVHFSRSELINLLDAFWAPLLVLSLTLALKKRGFWPVILGLVAGLTFHFYQGMRAMVAVTMIYFLVTSLRPGKKQVLLRLGNAVRNVFKMVAGLMVGLGPAFVVALFRPVEFFNTGTAGQPIIFTHELSQLISILPARMIRSYRVLITGPIGFHYQYGGPFLRLPLSVFFFIGLLVAVKKIRAIGSHFLLIWVGAVIFFNSTILPEMNYTHRLLSLVPALMIVTALGVDFFGRLFKGLRFWVVGLVLVVAAVLNLKVYFFDEVWKKTVLLNTDVASPAGFYVRKFPLTSRFYFLNSPRMSWRSVPSWEYLAQNYRISDVPSESFEKFLTEFPLDVKEVVVIALPERERDLKMIEDRFPGGEEKTFFFNSNLVFKSYER